MSKNQEAIKIKVNLKRLEAVFGPGNVTIQGHLIQNPPRRNQWMSK